MAKLVSKTYGDALFEVAMEESRIDEFFEAAKAVVEILETNEDFNKLMNHPKIGKEDKVKIVEDTLGTRIPKEMLSVLQYFIHLVKEEKKIGRADVTTAVALSDEQKRKVEKRLLETTVYESFEMNYQVDETLIGGMVIRIGDRVLDSSVKTKLYELSKSLRNIQV